MKKTLYYVGNIIIIAVVLDVMILVAVIGQIAQGESTPHIPFWDAQISAVAHVL